MKRESKLLNKDNYKEFFINTENIGGRLVAVAEELADVTETDNPNKVIGMSKYFMNYNYDEIFY